MERTNSHIKSLCLSFSSSDPVISPASSCAMYISLLLSAGCKQIYTAQYCKHSRRDIEPTVHCCNSQKKYHKRNALFETNLSQCSPFCLSNVPSMWCAEESCTPFLCKRGIKGTTMVLLCTTQKARFALPVVFLLFLLPSITAPLHVSAAPVFWPALHP